MSKKPCVLSALLRGFWKHQNQTSPKSDIILWLLRDILAQQACLDGWSASQIPPWRLKSGWGGSRRAHVQKHRIAALWILELFKQLLHAGWACVSSTTPVSPATPLLENSSHPHPVETVSWFLSIHMLILNFSVFLMTKKKISPKQLNKGFGGVNVPRWKRNVLVCWLFPHTQKDLKKSLLYFINAQTQKRTKCSSNQTNESKSHFHHFITPIQAGKFFFFR